MRKALAVAALAALFPITVPAGEAEFGIGESVLGHTVEVGYRINETFGLRGFHSRAGMSFRKSLDQDIYEGNLQGGSSGLFVDLYPLAGNMRLSLGLAGLGGINAAGSTTTSFEINGQTHDTALNLDARFRNDISPILTVGYSRGILASRIRASADIGAVYVGGFDVTATDPRGLIPENEMEAEADRLGRQLNRYDVLPFIKVEISVAF